MELTIEETEAIIEKALLDNNILIKNNTIKEQLIKDIIDWIDIKLIKNGIEANWIYTQDID